ncbi:MAG: serine/threonine protein kinase, partial [Myxococcales bacterium]|nr:serine/threonine protein kinase [Myxococcales bacterium]
MPAESEPPELGRVIGGKYRIDALLGRGGMGAVYAATNELTGKRVAVKRLLPAKSEDPNAAARFLREARIAARVEHPNVINVFDVGRDDDTSIFLVMELLDGTPLSALIREGGMEIERLIDILLLVMRGVQHAHDAGVVHRDLKPANLF